MVCGEISRKALGSNTAPSLIGDAVHIHIEALAEMKQCASRAPPMCAEFCRANTTDQANRCELGPCHPASGFNHRSVERAVGPVFFALSALNSRDECGAQVYTPKARVLDAALDQMRLNRWQTSFSSIQDLRSRSGVLSMRCRY